MDIDIERLKVDREYWSIASVLGSTYYDKETGLFCDEMGYYTKHGFKLWSGINPKTYKPGRFIPRPAKAPEVEWDGSGLPPAGCECEVRGDSDNWYKCKIIGHHGSRAVFFCDHWTPDSDYNASPASEFRPIRTKEQRQRDDLIAIIPHPGFSTKEEIAEAILSNYNLEPKQ